MPKPKKWISYRGNMPEFKGDAPKRIEKVNEVKKDFLKAEDEVLGLLLGGIKKDIKTLKEQSEEKSILAEAISNILKDRLINKNMQSFRLGSGELIFLKDEPYAKVINKEIVNKWVIENGMDELRTIPWQTLNEMVKDRLEKGEDVPPGVDVFLKTTAELRNG